MLRLPRTRGLLVALSLLAWTLNLRRFLRRLLEPIYPRVAMRFQRELLVLLFRITTYLKYPIPLPAHFMASSLVNWVVVI